MSDCKKSIEYFVKKLEEFADVIGQEIHIRRPENQSNRYICHFYRSGTRINERDPFFFGSHGNGRSPELSMMDYAKEISGKILVFEASGNKHRKEYNVPKWNENNGFDKI